MILQYSPISYLQRCYFVARAFIGGGGGIIIFSCYARLISFERN